MRGKSYIHSVRVGTPFDIVMRDRGIKYWLPSYIRDAWKRRISRLERAKKKTHIMFLVCDHFEPKHKIVEAGDDVRRVKQWSTHYPELYARCTEEFGHGPKHSWFYPPHHGMEHLDPLTEMIFGGFGELELHYHHDADTEESLRNGLISCLTEYKERGALIESNTLHTRFGFIHGDWALNNSNPKGIHCGVNDEITILKELGCWGDFTMPSSNECQTKKINSIYYSDSSPDKSKSHDSGVDLTVGKGKDGFLLMQGPLCINWFGDRYPKIENGSLTTSNWGRPDRVKLWIDTGIHVNGKPEWIFVKLHCHGAIERDFDSLWGERAFHMHKYLNERYNDGESYQLHYVTAREAYNIAKASEAGEVDNPELFRDYIIDKPTAYYYHLNAKHELFKCDSNNLKLKICQPQDNMFELKTKFKHVKKLAGNYREVTIGQEFCEIEGVVGTGVCLESNPLEFIRVVEGSVVSESSDVFELQANSNGRILVRLGS